MSWTTPRTYVPGELMTASIGNVHWRDNLNVLKTAISDDGDNWTGDVIAADAKQVGWADAYFTRASATAVVLNAALTARRAGIGTTSTDGFVFENTTAAAAGAQQYSPRARMRGFGWKTTPTAASQAVDFAWEVRPVQGSAAPTGTLVWSAAINGGAFSDLLTLSSAGQVLAVDGSAAAPTMAGVNYTTTGWYWSSGPTVNLSVSGTRRFAIDGTNWSLLNDSAVLEMGATPDVKLLRDGAANILALRNGTTAQKFNVYSTYTSGSNYRSICMRGNHNSGHPGISAEGAGATGASTRLYIGSDTDIYFDPNASTGILRMATDNQNDWGASGSGRPKNVYVATGVFGGTFQTTTSGYYAWAASMGGSNVSRIGSSAHGVWNFEDVSGSAIGFRINAQTDSLVYFQGIAAADNATVQANTLSGTLIQLRAIAASAPLCGFFHDTETTAIDFATNTTNQARLDSGGNWNLKSSAVFGWTSGTPRSTMDTYNTRVGAGIFGFFTDATHGVSVKVTADGVLQVLLRDGSTDTAATRSASFASARGTTGSIADSTPTTIFSASAQGRYDIYAVIVSAGSVGFAAIATVVSEGSDARLATFSNGNNLVITLSGTNVQVNQTSGGSATVTWGYIRTL